ncbi:MAG: cofactor-independent phosphoglycerate mutase [Duncaniella sp.]|uniref:cofactor-independent phosphoglycerate mutase n=1 Tax=Duncaniella sp. TaxID=2518496 RepID=UPI0023BEE58A|nr:cofactor-independent phosphoglycerate mutase [Duncaniella sp.]MDE6090268.1 cofactor-independent phosphoglycerate mutase [Duncaniella sp.]
MKHLIILGDGMSDHPVAALGGKTLLQYADTPALDRLAAEGRCGLLVTVPDGFAPGSEVANTAILGYDLNEVYEGRGPLEAASIGYEMQPDDMAMRCNIITLGQAGEITNHHGGHLTTEEGTELIKYLDSHLGNERVKFIPGIQYRHLLVIKGGNKHITCAPPHDNPGAEWRPLLVKPEPDSPAEDGRMTAAETADLINDLILRSQQLLADHPINLHRKAEGHLTANSIWPWSPGYRPKMLTLQQMYPSVSRGAVISAVDLIRGIGHYAGLRTIIVPGMTGLADTNYEGKTRAALDALRTDDFVFLHLEATDEAGHDGDLDLKLKAIEYLDRRVVAPILAELDTWDEPVSIALLPDHATPVEKRIHVAEPVPFVIRTPGVEPDAVTTYSEEACAIGSFGKLRLQEFMQNFMR